MHGRIDLITENDTNTVRLIDFKSTERAQAEDVSQDQLLIYAAGFRELDGRLPDFIEVINLDERGKAERERVEEANVARPSGVSRSPVKPLGRTGLFAKKWRAGMRDL